MSFTSFPKARYQIVFQSVSVFRLLFMFLILIASCVNAFAREKESVYTIHPATEGALEGITHCRPENYQWLVVVNDADVDLSGVISKVQSTLLAGAGQDNRPGSGMGGNPHIPAMPEGGDKLLVILMPEVKYTLSKPVYMTEKSNLETLGFCTRQINSSGSVAKKIISETEEDKAPVVPFNEHAVIEVSGDPWLSHNPPFFIKNHLASLYLESVTIDAVRYGQERIRSVPNRYDQPRYIVNNYFGHLEVNSSVIVTYKQQFIWVMNSQSGVSIDQSRLYRLGDTPQDECDHKHCSKVSHKFIRFRNHSGVVFYAGHPTEIADTDMIIPDGATAVWMSMSAHLTWQGGTVRSCRYSINKEAYLGFREQGVHPSEIALCLDNAIESESVLASSGSGNASGDFDFDQQEGDGQLQGSLGLIGWSSIVSKFKNITFLGRWKHIYASYRLGVSHIVRPELTGNRVDKLTGTHCLGYHWGIPATVSFTNLPDCKFIHPRYTQCGLIWQLNPAQEPELLQETTLKPEQDLSPRIPDEASMPTVALSSVAVTTPTSALASTTSVETTQIPHGSPFINETTTANSIWNQRESDSGGNVVSPVTSMLTVLLAFTFYFSEAI